MRALRQLLAIEAIAAIAALDAASIVGMYAWLEAFLAVSPVLTPGSAGAMIYMYTAAIGILAAVLWGGPLYFILVIAGLARSGVWSWLMVMTIAVAPQAILSGLFASAADTVIVLLSIGSGCLVGALVHVVCSNLPLFQRAPAAGTSAESASGDV